mgnify:CR=1 FL=1
MLMNTFLIDYWLDIYSLDVIGTNCCLFLAHITKLLLRHHPIDFCLTNVSRVWENFFEIKTDEGHHKLSFDTPFINIKQKKVLKKDQKEQNGSF